MILFPAPGGRTGNILFQLAYLESIRKDREVVFCTQLRGTQNLLDGAGPYRATDNPLIINLLDHIIMPLMLRPLAKLGLIAWHREIEGELKVSRGLLPCTLVEGYFQTDRYLGDLQRRERPFRLRRTINPPVRELLDLARGKRAVFLHVRRGDYLRWYVDGINDPSLPLSYYREGLARLRQAAAGQSLQVFLLGDDPDWCRQNFADIPDCLVVENTPLDDIVLMSCCDGGVVSNSSFGWWGGAFCSRLLPVFGPEFWIGWKSGRWHPVCIQTSWMQYLPIRTDVESKVNN